MLLLTEDTDSCASEYEPPTEADKELVRAIFRNRFYIARLLEATDLSPLGATPDAARDMAANEALWARKTSDPC